MNNCKLSQIPLPCACTTIYPKSWLHGLNQINTPLLEPSVSDMNPSSLHDPNSMNCCSARSLPTRSTTTKRSYKQTKKTTRFISIAQMVPTTKATSLSEPMVPTAACVRAYTTNWTRKASFSSRISRTLSLLVLIWSESRILCNQRTIHNSKMNNVISPVSQPAWATRV